ncbi:hypothetical protein, partial [Escherichia coli]|uniref:hypothetical protein n=1 Tax=Escherichia coli TaxID=562 RepID=UPI001F493FCA
GLRYGFPAIFRHSLALLLRNWQDKRVYQALDVNKAYRFTSNCAAVLRIRWLHGGGSSLRDPYAPRQGWKPTMGCTRAQNEDVDELCKKVTSWMYSHPGERIRYERFKTR